MKPVLLRCALLCVLALAGCTATPRTADVPDTHLARLSALALLQTLNAELLSHDSATATLERWCADHRLADPARIVAERVTGAETPLTEAQRALLRIDAAEPVRHRHVRLRCGSVVLSEADNWYVPSRLTPAMNEQLYRTDTPFGRVAQPLKFQRRTLSAELLWQPLPAGWEMQRSGADHPGRPLEIPDRVLEHRALLTVEGGTPISLVVETYTGATLRLPYRQR